MMIEFDGKLFEEQQKSVDKKTVVGVIRLQDLYARFKRHKKENFPINKFAELFDKEKVEVYMQELECIMLRGYDFLGENEEGLTLYLKKEEVEELRRNYNAES